MDGGTPVIAHTEGLLNPVVTIPNSKHELWYYDPSCVRVAIALACFDRRSARGWRVALMPIYSDNEAELEDRLATVLAGAGATTSLAASAAAALKSDPNVELTPRLKAAVSSVIQVFQRAASMEVAHFQEAVAGEAHFPEELVAQLAQPMATSQNEAEARKAITLLLGDLRSLLSGPSVEVAARVESFLGALSQAENSQAQALARGSLDLEFTAHSPIAV